MTSPFNTIAPGKIELENRLIMSSITCNRSILCGGGADLPHKVLGKGSGR